jgi:hypothetical protein
LMGVRIFCGSFVDGCPDLFPLYGCPDLFYI